MAEAAAKKRTNAGSDGKANARTPSPGEKGPQTEAAAAHAAPVCTVGFCPICLAVTAIQPLRPDVLEHLLVAGREFLLAAKAVLDARAEGIDGQNETSTTTFEKIDIG